MMHRCLVVVVVFLLAWSVPAQGAAGDVVSSSNLRFPLHVRVPVTQRADQNSPTLAVANVENPLQLLSSKEQGSYRGDLCPKKGGGYVRVKSRTGHEGYVPGCALTTAAQVFVWENSTAQLKQQPANTAKTLARLSPGTALKVLNEMSAFPAQPLASFGQPAQDHPLWLKVKKGGKEGWVRFKDLRPAWGAPGKVEIGVTSMQKGKRVVSSWVRAKSLEDAFSRVQSGQKIRIGAGVYLLDDTLALVGRAHVSVEGAEKGKVHLVIADPQKDLLKILRSPDVTIKDLHLRHLGYFSGVTFGGNHPVPRYDVSGNFNRNHTGMYFRSAGFWNSKRQAGVQEYQPHGHLIWVDKSDRMKISGCELQGGKIGVYHRAKLPPEVGTPQSYGQTFPDYENSQTQVHHCYLHGQYLWGLHLLGERQDVQHNVFVRGPAYFGVMVGRFMRRHFFLNGNRRRPQTQDAAMHFSIVDNNVFHQRLGRGSWQRDSQGPRPYVYWSVEDGASTPDGDTQGGEDSEA